MTRFTKQDVGDEQKDIGQERPERSQWNGTWYSKVLVILSWCEKSFLRSSRMTSTTTTHPVPRSAHQSPVSILPPSAWHSVCSLCKSRLTPLAGVCHKDGVISDVGFQTGVTAWDEQFDEFGVIGF